KNWNRHQIREPCVGFGDITEDKRLLNARRALEYGTDTRAANEVTQENSRQPPNRRTSSEGAAVGMAMRPPMHERQRAEFGEQRITALVCDVRPGLLGLRRRQRPDGLDAGGSLDRR